MNAKIRLEATFKRGIRAPLNKRRPWRQAGIPLPAYLSHTPIALSDVMLPPHPPNVPTNAQVWATHARLERDKAVRRGQPPEEAAEPFLLYTNCDMCDVARAMCEGENPYGRWALGWFGWLGGGNRPPAPAVGAGGWGGVGVGLGPTQQHHSSYNHPQPPNCPVPHPPTAKPCSYLDMEAGVTEPVRFQRRRGFDFRSHVEHCAQKDDPKYGIPWSHGVGDRAAERRRTETDSNTVVAGQLRGEGRSAAARGRTDACPCRRPAGRGAGGTGRGGGEARPG